MLTSVTPLGERGRGNRWPITAAWLMLGHLAGGLALGLLLVGVSALLMAAGLELAPSTVAFVVGGVVIVGALADITGKRMLGKRQVDDRWLTKYRGWVYGLGFGVQLGFGLVTVVNTALIGGVLVAGALLGGSSALIVGLIYGGVRGLVACGSFRVGSPSSLKRLHKRLDKSERPFRLLCAGLVAFLSLAAVVW